VKVLITDGAGFIVSHTADLLLEKGYEVAVLDTLERQHIPRKGSLITFSRGFPSDEADGRNQS